jgi:hypothetical protein
MVAMTLLDSAEESKLMVRAKMEFEWWQTRPPAVVDPLGILPIPVATGLPVAFDDGTCSVVEGCELRNA